MPAGHHGWIVPAGEGRRLRFPFGNELEIKAAAADGLRLGFFVSTLPAGAGMPFLHVHRSMDEAFEVVGGSVEYQLGDRCATAGAGAGVIVPAGVPHCFRAVGAATLVVMSAPAEGVDMVAELSEAGGDLDRFAEILARYDSELLERRPHWGQ